MAATVLVCDNEEPLRALVRASLESEDYVVLDASDGDEALSLARAHRPDLILLDMMMPGRSGLDVLAELRAEEGLADTQVVMLTARTQLTDRDAAAAAGADAFVAKPFSPGQLADLVAELVGSER